MDQSWGMPTAQAPNRRPRKIGPATATGPALLSEFFKTQAEAIEAARLQGIEEMVVTFRPNAPGARNVKTKIGTEELAKLWEIHRADKGIGGGVVVPTEKLVRAIEETGKVKTFYKTKEELFYALERQD